MKIALAQIRPAKADFSFNIEAHQRFIEFAIAMKANAIFFPELSLTGYEPELASSLATTQDDKRLEVFQQLTDKNAIVIGLGLPTKSETGIQISLIIFQPNQPRQTYSKQQLHPDEFPYFVKGEKQFMIQSDHIIIAPAICFESLQPDHAADAFELGANVYLASVAKPENGYRKATEHYPEVARKYTMPVLMSNSVGFCDNFLSVGKSSVWSKQGVLLAQLDDKLEGVLIYDTETEEVITKTLLG